MTNIILAKPIAYADVRCVACRSTDCLGNATSAWDAIRQERIHVEDQEGQWCNVCAHEVVEDFVITDPAEITRINAERARLRVRAAAEPLLDAVLHALQTLSDPAGLSPEKQGQLRSVLSDVIALAQGERASMTVESMLVLSTGHLQEDTCTRWLDTAPFAAFTKADYGWFVFVPEDLDEDPMPPDLLICCQLAHARGCAWIMFDRDAPALDTLPVYDW